MLVENVDKKAPFYRLKVDPQDASEVVFIKEGNFYIATGSKSGKAINSLPVIVDPEVIFGQVNDFSYPVNFVNAVECKPPKMQMDQGRLPCAMACGHIELKESEEVKLYCVAGHMSSKEALNSSAHRLRDVNFFIAKREENKSLIKEGQIYRRKEQS